MPAGLTLDTPLAVTWPAIVQMGWLDMVIKFKKEALPYCPFYFQLYQACSVHCVGELCRPKEAATSWVVKGLIRG